jgi:hypothetical protein
MGVESGVVVTRARQGCGGREDGEKTANEDGGAVILEA